MKKLIIIKLNGSFLDGFQVTLEIGEDGKRPCIELNSSLPPNFVLPQIYQDWYNSYYHLDVINRITPVNIRDNSFDLANIKQTCDEKSQNLRIRFNDWLKSDSFFQIREKCLEQLILEDEIRVIIRTPDSLLRKLPWHLWDFWQKYPLAEVAIGAQDSQVIEKLCRQKIRILIILGNSKGINVAVDRNLLAQYCHDAEIVFLTEPSPQELNQHLWDRLGWDILVFSGHSRTEGTQGRIFLNQKDSLTMTELKYALQKALAQGLQIGLFNSCDGLGIASELESLHIPQLIVMRELVPDLVAHQFLKYFLEEYTSGKSLYISVGIARKKLQGIEKDFPCASWLPVIVQNLLSIPPTWQSLGVISQCPYRGLAAFREEDTQFFFGRESVASELAATVTNKPLVALIGASGSGKSSLVFAGLIPHLRQERNPQWQIVCFRPGNNPFESLAIALVSALPSLDSKSEPEQENYKSKQERVQELEKQLRQSNSTLQTILENFVAPSSHPSQSQDFTLQVPRFLLVADQFEELYTLCLDARERKLFLDGLLNVVQNTPLFTLVVTLRADFLGRALDYAPLGKALQDYTPELLISMNRKELETAIALPAEKLNVRLEPGLIKAIADDVTDSKGSLPMLEFALAQLWTKQRSGWLTHQAYQEIGGSLRALANHAEAVYAQLDKRQREVAQQVFIQLVQPGEGTEDTRKLATRLEVGENNWNLVTLLASERLVVTNFDLATKIETVEIIHEALIKNWGRLRQWIDSNREFRTWQERLKIAWHQWETTRFDEDALLRGVSLAEAEQWLKKRFQEINPAHRRFIEQGAQLREQKKQQEEQQKRRTILGLSGCLVLALSLAGQALWQWQQSTNEQLNSISISSNALLKSNQDLDALLEAIKAARQLKFLVWVNPETRKQVNLSLQRAVYNVKEDNRLEGHNDGVGSVDVSPDGQTIVSASRDNTIVLWSLDGRKIKTFIGHDDEVSSVSFSPDGKAIVSASYDGTIKLWSIKGQEIKTFRDNGNRVSYVSFSPDGKIIVSSDIDRKTIELWSIDGQKLKSLALSSYHGWGVVKFSPNGKTLAAASTDGNVKLWSLDGRELKSLGVASKSYSIDVLDISFSPDSNTIATAHRDATIKLWNLDGQKLKTLARYSQSVTSIRFSPDGKMLATACTDGTIGLWSLDGRELKTFKGHIERVTSLSFSPDGKSLISSSADDTVKIWHINSQEPKTFIGNDTPLWDVSFSPNGKIIASAGTDDTITLWNLNGQKLKSIKTSKSDRGWTNGISFSPDGKMVAATSWDKTIKLWNLDDGKLKTFKGHSDMTNDVNFSPNGKIVVSASDDRTIKLWNLDGRLLKTFAGHRSGVWSVSFSPDGKKIASADRHGAIAIWNLQGRVLKHFQGHGSITSVSFSPDGKTIVSGSSDKTIKLWSLDGRELKSFKGHVGGVSEVRFSPDGQLIASSSSDSTIKLWSVMSGEELKMVEGNGYSFWNLSFNPDGKTIASVNDNGLVQIWSTEILDFDRLIERGCYWLHDYLKNNPNVSDRDRYLCDGI